MSEILAMILFALALSITPGPVNVITLSIGVTCGARAAVPFVSGATVGFTALLVVLGLGLSQLVGQAGWLLDVLNIAGIGFIFYLGIRIAGSDTAPDFSGAAVPGFCHGAALQWLNPKAWGACIAGIGAFGVAQSLPKLMLFSGLYLIVCFIGVGAWAVLGQTIRRFFNSPRNRRLFNRGIGGGLMVLALLLLWQTYARSEYSMAMVSTTMSSS